jgi:hypothetical protein
MASLPLAKLGALLIRTLTKPIAKRLENHVKESDLFRQLFVRFGRGINSLQIVYSRRIMGMTDGTVSSPQPSPTQTLLTV